ncbi:hypothetical protein AB4Y32_26160 [Paraburkholderia phymatum]|uniref:Uncharacterized protein n=1 Tax=Paraburkholderia phymatum TaxID=148447 RepID=A0ACC6U6C6_9BURK
MSTYDATTENNVYSEAQRRIEEDLKRRAEENQARVDEIRQQRSHLSRGLTPLIIVADGDSWFDLMTPSMSRKSSLSTPCVGSLFTSAAFSSQKRN